MEVSNDRYNLLGVKYLHSSYIYAIREIETGKLMNAKCGSGGKFYQIKGHAQRRCDKYNSKREQYEIVTYELVEVKQSI